LSEWFLRRHIVSLDSGGDFEVLLSFVGITNVQDQGGWRHRQMEIMGNAPVL